MIKSRASKQIWTNYLGALFFLGFNWIILEAYQISWKLGPLWIVLATVIFLLGISVSAFKNRAKYYYFLLALLLLPIVFGFLDMTHLFIRDNTGASYTVVLVFIFCSWLIYICLRVLEERQNVKVGRQYLIKTNKFDPQKAEWDLKVPLHLQDRQNENKTIKKWQNIRRLSPLLPPIAFYVNRNLSFEVVHFIIGLSYYVLAITFSWAMGRMFSVGLVLQEWELELGQNIKIMEP